MFWTEAAHFLFQGAIKDTFFKAFLKRVAVVSFGLFLFAMAWSYVGTDRYYFDDSFVPLPFPKHSVQLTSTFFSFLPEMVVLLISSGLMFVSAVHKQQAMQHVTRYWLYFMVHIAVTHFYIWFMMQPYCVTGCEDGASGNDGQEDVLFATYGTMSWLLVVLILALNGTRDKAPRGLHTAISEFHKWALIHLTFIMGSIVFGLVLGVWIMGLFIMLAGRY